MVGMRRREFITLFGAAVAAWPLAARAQQTTKLPKIGVLWHADNAEQEAPYLTPLQQSLSNLGYVDGRNMRLLNTYAAERYERFNSNAAQLAKIPVDVLVAVTRPAAFAAQKATTTIPIVFILVPDPVRSKLVNSLSRPGGNITGLTQLAFELSGKRLDLFKEATGLSSVALLVNSSDQEAANLSIAEFRDAAARLNVDLHVIEVKKPEDIEGAFDAIAKQGLRGALTVLDAMLFNERKRIARLAIERRVGVMGHIGEMTVDGLLISYAANYPNLFRRAGIYVDKILKGEKPGEIPVEQPTKFELIINLKTAKALGLEIPPTLVARADEVIE
jgi:putative tryptophan/tyrosine transport system substrate-binding protein